MEISNSPFEWTITGYFNGIPCQIIGEVHMILDPQGKSTKAFVTTPEFEMLSKAGIEVHSGTYS